MNNLVTLNNLIQGSNITSDYPNFPKIEQKIAVSLHNEQKIVLITINCHIYVPSRQFLNKSLETLTSFGITWTILDEKTFVTKKIHKRHIIIDLTLLNELGTSFFSGIYDDVCHEIAMHLTDHIKSHDFTNGSAKAFQFNVPSGLNRYDVFMPISTALCEKSVELFEPQSPTGIHMIIVQ